MQAKKEPAHKAEPKGSLPHPPELCPVPQQHPGQQQERRDEHPVEHQYHGRRVGDPDKGRGQGDAQNAKQDQQLLHDRTLLKVIVSC